MVEKIVQQPVVFVEMGNQREAEFRETEPVALNGGEQIRTRVNEQVIINQRAGPQTKIPATRGARLAALLAVAKKARISLRG
ncbi:MAG: hypothetical protein GTN69_06515 [Armatimonadetes bacterium]|nr:hypothetical protein [Armatimonadota bacterium]